MKGKLNSFAVFMVGVFAIFAIIFGNVNIANASTKMGDIRFKKTSVEYMDANTIKITGFFYNTGEESGIVKRVMYQLGAYDEEGEVIFKTKGNRIQRIQPTRVMMNSQSEECTIIITDEAIRPYDGEVEWSIGILAIVVDPIK